jgi:hypothetical protein
MGYDGSDWRSERMGSYPIGDKHTVEEEAMKFLLWGTW